MTRNEPIEPESRPPEPELNEGCGGETREDDAGGTRRVCPHCGADADWDAATCDQCGAALNSDEPVVIRPAGGVAARVVALVLLVFVLVMLVLGVIVGLS